MTFIERLKHYYWSLREKKPAFEWPGQSNAYWEQRYAKGGSSGLGSYGKFAEFKAEVLNDFVSKKRIGSVIEFGCGDGNQLNLAHYPYYLGFDVSATAISLCQQRFSGDPTKEFRLLSSYKDERAELTLSLDVIYHLIEDHVFADYMQRLFTAADRFVIIYSSNHDDASGIHVRHRLFSNWINEHASEWNLVEKIPNRYPYDGSAEGSFADFFIYEKS